MKTDTAFFFAVLSLLFLSAGASLVTVENVDVVPEGWKLHGRANTSEQISLSIALKQHKIEALKTRLDAISSPGSPNYGNHLSREDVQSQRAAEPQDVSLVRSWLAAHGVDVVLARDWMTFNTTVGNAEGLLNTKLYSYSFEDRKSVIRAHTYSVPLEISSAVDFVHPLCNFMPPSLPRLKPAPMAQRLKSTCGRPELPCNGGTDPACIRALYNINYTAPIGNSPVKFGIAGFLEQYINYEDTSTFMKRYVPEIEQTGYNFTVELVSGGENPQDKDAAGMEASLDVQYAMALGYPTNVIYYSVGGRGIELDGEGIPYHATESDNEPFVEFLDYLLDRTDEALPHVISISYADDELSVPKAYALRTCDMFAALAARGVSVLVASGDGGSRGTGQRLCYSNDGRGREMTLPTFPASCPYVTTVGATTNSGPPVTGAGFSTGGFSNYFRRPEWQSDAVAEYIAALNGTLKGRYNPSGRAYPDISAIGSGFAIEWGGTSSSVLGTSASCPVVAAMVALVNDARLRAGKRPVGWLNPILYSEKMRAVLQDVVEGQSYSCSWNGDAPGGWPAKPGFDTITGLGVPNDFEKFLKVFMDLD
ncbi:tripeptidyl peptidase sed3 [Colletotrichum truncatum]|uniref:Tripeptidyl peptidase sed3 n=1 Tax=Colletotrichum truncatum TaxID=5467 RepID=A0ACC3ZLL2_COLTU|nr:tripeptidyl peptidase sed3 [Colletotrichum truncatum]KAF6783969.1 tripeptidyl peptidase sed3 [Colletotrichum truncatum]